MHPSRRALRALLRVRTIQGTGSVPLLEIRPEPTAAPADSEPAKPQAAARDIRLEVAHGERRVEVRLVDRGGDVHLAVRTPDQRLSSALREGLPDLAAQLEQSGFHAEPWHAGPAGERPPETARPSGAPDPHSRPQPDGRRGQSDPEGRQAKDFEELPNRKQKGKEFTWFMSSLR